MQDYKQLTQYFIVHKEIWNNYHIFPLDQLPFFEISVFHISVRR